MSARSKKHREGMVPITEEDLERFHKNAPAALARRGGGAMWEECLAGLQTAAFGLLPIVGLVWWGWSATEMLLFMLVGLWVGILCDTAKVFMLHRRALAFAAAAYDDWHVWVVVGALRDGSNKAIPSHLNAKWAPYGGVFVDFVMGGISTALIVVMLVAEAGLGRESFQAPYVLAGIAGFALVRVLETAWEIYHHRANDRLRAAASEGDEKALVKAAAGDRPVKAVVGLRGVGLFLLVFLTAVLTDKDEGLGAEGDRSAWWMMLVVNSLVVLYGLVNLTGPLWLRGETLWLQRYLAERAESSTRR